MAKTLTVLKEDFMMEEIVIKITGTGSALPEKRLTNFDLQEMVETSDEWIRERTGIAERRVAEEGENLASLAAKAAQKALEMAGRSAEEIDMILVATCSPDDMLPCCACQVQGLIGAKNATAFDINAACSGFLFGLQTAYAYLQTGMYKRALVIGAEVLSKLVDWTDRSTCVLFGDGAGAALLECSTGQKQFLGFVQGAIGEKGMVLSCARTKFVQMNGQEVYRFAVKQVPQCIEDVLEKTGLSIRDIDLFVLHQANVRIIEAVAKRLKVDIEKFPMNLSRVGNMSSATIPVLLDELNREGKLETGQKVVLSGFGAGLTYGACVLVW